jgi:predicted Zn-dependent protease with MMP-like domain
MTNEEFEKVIEETIESLPEEIKSRIDNVVFHRSGLSKRR